MVETRFPEFLLSGWKETAKSAYHDDAAGRVSQVFVQAVRNLPPFPRARSANQ
jgi:hypothetical protein